MKMYVQNGRCKFEVLQWYILEKGYIEHNDHFSTNSESDVFEASVDNGWAIISDRWQFVEQSLVKMQLLAKSLIFA